MKVRDWSTPRDDETPRYELDGPATVTQERVRPDLAEPIVPRSRLTARAGAPGRPTKRHLLHAAGEVEVVR